MISRIKIRCYECKKCNKTVYFRSDEEYETICKTCKNEMKFVWEHDYKPKAGLTAIKNSNGNQKNNTEFYTTDASVIECPYCHSTNTKKITNSSKAVHTALFGVFSLSRNSKQFHCNNCKADF